MNARTFSATLNGIDGKIIEIEAATQDSLPKIQIAGLPGDVVKESRERVQACLNALGFRVPSCRVVVHLSPASAKKQGSQFDFGIAMAVLVAEGLAKGSTIVKAAFLGELALDGRVKRVPFLLPLLETLENWEGVEKIFLSKENEAEAVLLSPKKVSLVSDLGEVLDHLGHGCPLETIQFERLETPPTNISRIDRVQGQGLAKRALQVALAGRHHLLLVGPPGVGKSMLAHCASELLPPLTREEAMQSAKLLSLSSSPGTYGRPVFRAPHHTISPQGLLGGGSGVVVPGEVTFAHQGVLFLDEFPEFSRPSIEGLREPLQNGSIHVHRVGAHYSFPAQFTLLVAMNPCPCGYFFSTGRKCACSSDQVNNYRRRVSGPLLDRFDLLVMMGFRDPVEGAKGKDLAEGIVRAVTTQRERYGPEKRNGDHEELPEMEREALVQWEMLRDSGQWSYRALSKMGRVARTLADLEGQPKVQSRHLMEAKLLRCPESLGNYWR